jgi:hypothetical protein
MMKKEGMFCRHSSSWQPHLTEQHMAARFAYALDEEVHPVQGPDGCYQFKDMYDRVDVNEKWFYLTRKSEAYILITANDEDNEGESHVYRAVKNTKHLKMVMFCVRKHIRRGGITMLRTKCGMVRLGCGLLDSFNQQQEQVQIDLGEHQCGTMKR